MKLFMENVRFTYESKFFANFKANVGLVEGFEMVDNRDVGGFGVESCVVWLICIVLHFFYVCGICRKAIIE